ncbi:hypothetical protein FB45DRAFT_860347 [Roridomyces roridus]|uniref:MYND-type domain-containing protein n=1 Tax=Roridomyces roridus TaxID=1738132 RepID=A0AAD7CEY1_9AGAR|nr:hypothetical protein FB45DRAFT_860347 [Roridomyces roridus]
MGRGHPEIHDFPKIFLYNSGAAGKKLVVVPDIVGLIGRLWTENLALANNTVHDELIFIIQCILENRKTDSVLSVLIDAVGGAKTFMEAALDRFRRLSSVGQVVVEDIAPQLMFISFLTENLMILHDVMHEVDVFSATLPAIGSLTQRAEGSIIGLLQTLYDARIAFLYSEDTKALVKAVEFILKHVIALSLVFRSVLHAVERSDSVFIDYAEYRSEIDVPALPEWETFYNYYLITFASRNSLDRVFRAGCGLSACAKRDDNGDFKRCGKCQHETYCSKECQQLAWREQILLRQARQIIRGPLLCPVSDREFVRKMAIFEVHQHMKTLWERIQSHPTLAAPNADLMFQVDFTTVEKDITVAPVDESMDPSQRRGKAFVFGKVKAGREVYMVLAQMTGMFMLKKSL